jgi:outer membrane lipoprotein-sorting protein
MREQYSVSKGWLALVIAVAGLLIMGACQPPAGNVASNKTNTNLSIPAGNSNSNSSTTSTSAIETKEPGEYQAKVDLKFEAVGEQQSTQLPAIGAIVARSGADRRMEFSLPTGEKVVYLDKGDTHYLILPNRSQYAELNKEALGFEVRGMLMPENIVNQVKSMKGVELVGEENLNGRQVLRYRYGASADTKTKAGTVETQSFVIVDKETGLPLRSETLSQSQGGANVQGYKGLKFVTEMSDVKTAAPAELFEVPKGFAKIDPEQVKSQAKMIFDAAILVIGQAMKQGQPNPPATPQGN